MRIEAPHFVAGLIIDAPIVKYMIGWNTAKVKEYCNKKNWSCGEDG